MDIEVDSVDFDLKCEDQNYFKQVFDSGKSKP